MTGSDRAGLDAAMDRYYEDRDPRRRKAINATGDLSGHAFDSSAAADAYRFGFGLERSHLLEVELDDRLRKLKSVCKLEDSRIKHNHDYVGVWKKGTITWNQSNCYNDNPNSRNSCETLYGYSGAEMHKHKIQFSMLANYTYSTI